MHYLKNILWHIVGFLVGQGVGKRWFTRLECLGLVCVRARALSLSFSPPPLPLCRALYRCREGFVFFLPVAFYIFSSKYCFTKNLLCFCSFSVSIFKKYFWDESISGILSFCSSGWEENATSIQSFPTTFSKAQASLLFLTHCRGTEMEV